MAKKVVNVVYNVDNSQLQVTKLQLQAIQKETKASEDAMTKMGASGKASGQQIANTYAGMQLQMQQLRAQIDLTKTSDTQRLTELKAQYGQVKTKVDAFNQSIVGTKNATDDANKSFLSFKNTIATVLSVAFIKQITSSAIELTKLAGEVQGVDAAFKRAFSNADTLLANLRKSTHNTVSDFDLMKRTLQATNLGVSVEHLGTLFEFAAVRAQQTGESVDYLVDSIVRGIGRKSILVLDNLGLSATRLKAQFGGVSIASKSVAEVTAGIAEIAKVELGKMGGYVETGATKVAQLSVSFQTLRQELAKKVEETGIVGWLNDFINAVRRSSMSFAEIQAEKNKIFGAEDVQNFIDNQKQTIKAIDDEILYRKMSISALKNEMEVTKETDAVKYFGQKNLYDQRLEALRQLEIYRTQFIKNQNAEVKEPGIIEAIKDEINNLNDALEKETSKKGILDTLKKIADAEQRLKAAKLPVDLTSSETNQNDVGSQAYQDALDMLETEQKDSQKNREDALKDYWKTVKSINDNAYRSEQQQATDKANNELKDTIDAEKKKLDIKKQFSQRATQVGLQSLNEVLTATLINRDNIVQAVTDEYDQKIAAAGENQKQIDILNKQKAAAEAQARQRQVQADAEAAETKIWIDAATASIGEIARYGWLGAIPFIALDLAAAGVQAATVKSVASRSLKTRAYAKGEVDIDGPGTMTSDSIPSMLSKHESVINAESTLASKALLNLINDGKIDDRILHRLAANGGHQPVTVFDDSKIVSAIKETKSTSLKEGYTAYEIKETSKNFKLKMRHKYQGY